MKLNWKKSSRRKKVLIAATAVLCAWYFFCLPSRLFKDPTCTVLDDKNGILIAARIADDGQWRFPHNEKVPEKFEKAITQFEDKYFFYHPGVNLLSTMRAFWQNISSGKIVSGGSTLTMQTIRLSRKGQDRTVIEKLIEMILATRAEISYSKDEILALYASNAPFGGNVVGLDAAAWRYFGRSPEKLSWAESAMLAVLPNAPSLIYPGKNHERLLQKRNRLLDALWKEGEIDSVTCALSKTEPLPEKPFPLPQLSPHLLDRAFKEGLHGQRVLTTLDQALQERAADIVQKHSNKLRGNQVWNAAAIVAEVETGHVLAYVGNTAPHSRESEVNNGWEIPSFSDKKGESVDVIMSPRSTGSILKPFLYAAMLSEGEILPNTLVPDVPTQIGDFSPQNYYLSYDGAVPARRALARSLNVPSVKMLQQFGVERFHYYLKKMGVSTVNRPASHYGLSLILGGAEAKLWDLAGIYASMARSLNHANRGENYSEDFFPLHYFKSSLIAHRSSRILNAASIYLTFEAMSEVNRPDMDASWHLYSSSAKIAWKTGTSFGYRDGWAIGVTPKYVVGVWVGNANGEGRPNLTGVGTAAPILFEIFSLLNPAADGWFKMPKDEMKQISVCSESGYRALEICERKEKVWVPEPGLRTVPCPYHRMVHLDASGKWRVNSDCEPVANMTHKSWFMLPAAMEWYYKTRNPLYHELPPFRSDCKSAAANSMELIYPKPESKIYVPVELDETTGKTVFRVAHRKPETVIYWHVDDNYISSTRGIHEIGIAPEPGRHTLTLVDEFGETISQRFEIIGKK